MKKPVISTPRLTLCPMKTRDINALLTLFTDPIVTKNYMVPEFATREDALPLAHKIIALSCDPHWFIYGIYLQDTLIGLVNETEIQDKTIELGFAILPAYHNQGYATEVLNACINFLIDNGYEAVRTGVFSENASSRRVMEKAEMARLPLTENIEYRGKTHRCLFYERAHKNIPENKTFCL